MRKQTNVRRTAELGTLDSSWGTCGQRCWAGLPQSVRRKGCRAENSPLPGTGWEDPSPSEQVDCVITGGQEGKPSETGGLGFAEGTTLTTMDNGTLLFPSIAVARG